MEQQTAPALNLARQYVHRGQDGMTLALDVTATLFSEILANAALRSGTLVGIIHLEEGLSHWECHPAGDEILYLLSGAIDMTIDGEDGTETLALTPDQAVVIPRNSWHQAMIHEPSRVLFVTPIADSKVGRT